MTNSPTNTTGLRVGFIGTGWTERVQAPAFRLGGLTIQAIASGHLENAQRVAQNLEIPDVHEDWRSLVESDAVDIVSIVTPPHLHAEMAEAALKAGKHVICEKPTALNVTEAEAMLAAAQAAPECMAIIDHELRFTPQRVQLRELVRSGYVGTVLTFRIADMRGSRLDPTLPWTWWSDADWGGGMLGAVGSHMFDLARWTIGRVDSMTAQLRIGHYYRTDPATGTERQVTADDHAHLLLRFANGVLGTITVSSLSPGEREVSVEVNGTEGALRLDAQERLWGMRGENFPNGDWEQIPVADPVMETNQLSNNNPFARGSVYLSQAIAKSLSEGEVQIPEAASFYDGLAVQRALDAARRSHQERTWVRL
jgi:predicted dehydrogenase